MIGMTIILSSARTILFRLFSNEILRRWIIDLVFPVLITSVPASVVAFGLLKLLPSGLLRLLLTWVLIGMILLFSVIFLGLKARERAALFGSLVGWRS